MRRCVQIIGLVLLAAASGGWGAIVASALCPHANPGRAARFAPGMMSDEHACRPAKPSTPAPKAHCHDSAVEQDAMGEMIVERDGAEAARGVARFFGNPEAACAHCIGRSEIPSTTTAAAREKVQAKRIVHITAAQASLAAPPRPSFTSPVLYRQGAPPGAITPRHLLISVLLI